MALFSFAFRKTEKGRRLDCLFITSVVRVEVRAGSGLTPALL